MSRLATPGVYIVEQNAFTSSVVAVPTAVPAFIGYTEKAERDRDSLLNKPTRITSLAEYVRFFGGAPKTTFTIKADATKDFDLRIDTNTQYYLFNSIRAFFANGGGACYIVSVGDYSRGVKLNELNDQQNGGGLMTLLKEQEPTMVVVPDAVLLSREECYDLYKQVLKHCGVDTKSRFAILDVHDGHKERTLDNNDVVTAFREGVGNNHLAFGAGYYPWVKTTIVTGDEVSYKNVSNLDELIRILTKEAERTFLGDAVTTTTSVVETPPPPISDASVEGDKPKKPPVIPPRTTTQVTRVVDPKLQKKFDAAKEEIEKLRDPNANASVVEQNVKALGVVMKNVLDQMRQLLNIMPTSGVMAGIYALVDNMQGVHKAPANVSLSSVVAPIVNITSEQQEDLNLPLNGKAVNAIRGFVGKGVLVWGARTLDGNSQDWRYINVRRTMVMIEQSIKIAAEAYVFEANNGPTWLKIRTSIENFLTDVWKSGALMGGSPAEAFDVSVGLGSTMTPVDILDGIMRISVKVAVVRPAEFIVITFQQKMVSTGA